MPHEKNNKSDRDARRYEMKRNGVQWGRGGGGLGGRRAQTLMAPSLCIDSFRFSIRRRQSQLTLGRRRRTAGGRLSHVVL